MCEVFKKEKYFYKFRSTETLLDRYNELEKEYIYFSKLNDLNDPIEGFFDVYWQGDEILWGNFFKNYLYSFYHFSLKFFIDPEYPVYDQHNYSNFDIEVRNRLEQTDTYKAYCQNFFENNTIQKFLFFLNHRKIKKEELSLYLNFIHLYLIDNLLNIYKEFEQFKFEDTFCSNIQKASEYCIKNLDVLITNLSIENEEKQRKLLAEKFKEHSNNLDFHCKIFDENNTYEMNYQAFFAFPNEYLNRVRTIMYPESFVSCFSKNCTDASMWGYYANSHKGICLIFEPTIKDDYCYLSFIDLQKEFLKNQIPLKLSKVNYVEKYPELSFFRSLGNVIGYEFSNYWASLNGKFSPYIQDIVDNEKEWHKKYWEWINNCLCTKTKDWEKENEYRIILTNILDAFSEKNDRCLKYDFKQLKGIIFGIKTSKKDKLKIISIIQEKCKIYKITDFKFYQSSYNNENGQIVINEIDLTKQINKEKLLKEISSIT